MIIATSAAVIAYLQLRRTPRVPAKALKSAGSPYAPGPYGDIRPLHNLPPREKLIGRAAEKRRLLEGLASPYPVSLEGLGGMGKTALAREVAWLLVENTRTGKSGQLPTFDVIVWTEDREGVLRRNDVLDAIAEVLGLPYVLSLPGVEKIKAISRVLRSVTCLLIVDNLETVNDPDLLEFLRQPPSKTIVISRTHRLSNAWVVAVGKLDQVDGLRLIKSEAQRLGHEFLAQASDSMLLEIHDATGGNPLAIRLTAGQIKAEGTSIKEIVGGLERAEARDIFNILFSRSWYLLLQYDEFARRVLMALSLFAGSASREALEMGASVHGSGVRSAIRRLTGLSLVDVAGVPVATASRYQLHTLTKAFIRRQLESESDTLVDMTGRLIEYFLRYAIEHSDTYSDLSHVDALNAERANIMAFAETSYLDARGRRSEVRWRQVIQFSDAMSAYLWGRGLWDDRILLCERAREAADALNDNEAAVRQAVFAGRVRLLLKDVSGAKDYLAYSQALLGEAAGETIKSMVKRLRAQIASAEGNFTLAESLLSEILQGAPTSTDDEGQAATLLELGLVAERQGRLLDARGRYENALRLDEAMNTIEGQAVSMSHLGRVLLQIGDLEAAQSTLSQGLELAQNANRLDARGRCELELARLYIENGDRNKALDFARLAETTFVRLGMHAIADEARSAQRAARRAR